MWQPHDRTTPSLHEEVRIFVPMTQIQVKMYIQNNQDTPPHPLDGATANLIRTMTMAAKDVEAMCNEKGEEWAETEFG